MIKVVRPAEPPALAAARVTALAKLRPNGPATRKDLPADYKKAHPDLWKAQHYKCAYCECREQSRRNDVEHFRPATRANREPGSVEKHGYWWLAFTWENLLFACRNCNQSPYKLDKFPLDVGSTALQPEELPPGEELPLLIDPAEESAVDHIEFVGDNRGRWFPRARNGSAKGACTIKTCGLDRPDLLDLYAHHVDKALGPDLLAVRALVTAGDDASIRLAFDRFCARHLQPSSIFAALARDVLAAEVPEALRTQLGMTLPAL